MAKKKDSFRDAEHWTICPNCGNDLGWNTEDGLKGQTCSCGHVFTGRERQTPLSKKGGKAT